MKRLTRIVVVCVLLGLCLFGCSTTTTQIAPLIVSKTVSLPQLEITTEQSSERSRYMIHQAVLSAILTSRVIAAPSSSHRLSDLVFMIETEEGGSEVISYDEFYRQVNQYLTSYGTVEFHLPDYKLSFTVLPDKQLIRVTTQPWKRIFEYEDAGIRFQYNTLIVDFRMFPQAFDMEQPISESMVRDHILIYQDSVY